MEDKYSKIDKRVEVIVKKVSIYMPNLNIKYIREEIFKAYEYARDAHEWQYRLSWEPYISHPVEATMILLELKPDIFTIQSCLLHDVIEDTPKTKEDIEKKLLFCVNDYQNFQKLGTNEKIEVFEVWEKCLLLWLKIWELFL